MKKPFLRKVNLGTDTSGRPLVVNRRTKAMVEVVEGRVGRRLVIIQGSFMNGHGADDSGPTHDKAGVIDVRSRDLTAQQAAEVVREMRKVGFAAFQRTTAQGFDENHIHAVAIGDPGLDPSAKAQVKEYRRGLNGLGGADTDAKVRIKRFPL